MSRLSLSSVREGLRKIRKLGHERETFTARDIEFEIRTITREELSFANERAQPFLEEAQESESSFALSEWLQEVKIGVLSFAIMRIGDINLNGVDYLVNDQDPSNPEEVQKTIFVRELLEEWEDSLVNVIYKKFQGLTERAEENSQKGVEFLDQDPRDELKELEEKVQTLRGELGLPSLVPEGSETPEKAPRREEMPEPTPEPNADVRALKSRVLEPQTGLPVEEERDGYVYEADTARQHLPPAESEVPAVRESDEDLTQEQMVARENERLYQERQQRQGREPLNQTAVNVRQEQSPQTTPTRTANATQRIANLEGESYEFIPNPNGPEVLGASEPTPAPQKKEFKANPKPKGKGNPNFYSPNRRK